MLRAVKERTKLQGESGEAVRGGGCLIGHELSKRRGTGKYSEAFL